MRHFWAAARDVDPAAAELDEGVRFSFCRPDTLASWWTSAGLEDVHVDALSLATVFGAFDEYWLPFLGGQGAAPGFLLSLPEERRDLMRRLLLARLPVEKDGSIHLTARAWAVRGVVA